MPTIPTAKTGAPNGDRYREALAQRAGEGTPWYVRRADRFLAAPASRIPVAADGGDDGRVSLPVSARTPLAQT
jgi:hypothetical protein